MALSSTRATAVLTLLLLTTAPALAREELPDTGISGVYEVMVGTDDAQAYLRYFAEFGFRVVAEGRLSAAEAQAVYGVSSAVTSYRLQNGAIDSHGLARVLEWETPTGPGIGYAPPETIGMRMAVMRTEDIFRLHDVYQAARDAGEKWLPIEPVYDDLYDLTEGDLGIFNRPVGVRETAIYGELFHHVFFQRYGYKIPGYGTVSAESPLRTSEFTHHDFVITGGSMEELTDYYRDALGFQPESDEVELDGDWQPGPRRVFDMQPGTSHWYRGFVSPNNICGKLKFFVPTGPRPDRSAQQIPGSLGISLHSLYTPKLSMVRGLVEDSGITPREIVENEFGERSFTFTGPDGATWQIIERSEAPQSPPVLELDFERVNN